MEKIPALGEQVLFSEQRRDAVHIAVVPVTAAEQLSPGQHVGFVNPDNTEIVGLSDQTIGVVDPFLKLVVERGQRFWLCLYPSSIRSLRHMWCIDSLPLASAIQRRRETHAHRQRTLAYLTENEDDTACRLVFADWLDEQGEHDEAIRHRKWPIAKQWFEELLCSNDSDGGELRSTVAFREIVDAGTQAWSERKAPRAIVKCGADRRLRDRLREVPELYWANWSVITGNKLPPDYWKVSAFACLRGTQKG